MVKAQLAGFEKFARRVTGKNNMARLDSRVALLPAAPRASAGIMRRRWRAEGARLMIADIADGKDLAAEIAREHGANSVASSITDVSDEGAVKKLVAQTPSSASARSTSWSTTPLCSRRCRTPKASISTSTLWDRVMAVNMRGVFLMAKHVAPHMIAQKSGKIINISLRHGRAGIPSMAHYVTSKGAVMAFTRSLSRELGEHNICVNKLAPGFTLSDTVVNENPGTSSIRGRRRHRPPRHQARPISRKTCWAR